MIPPSAAVEIGPTGFRGDCYFSVEATSAVSATRSKTDPQSLSPGYFYPYDLV
jgi:hypothetical protein